MSVLDENIHPANPAQQIDRLVDGELSEGDRQDLLLELERQPDGWRRCALAFLEAQCWKAELRQMAGPAAPDLVRSETVPSAGVATPQDEPGVRGQSWRHYAATVLTIAASFLIALIVGIGLRGNWSGGSAHSPDALLRNAKDEFPLVAHDPASVAAMIPAAQTAPAASNSATGGWEMVTLAGAKSSDGESETYCVPAQCRDALDPDLLEQIPDAMPPEVQQAFEQSGHRIVQQREIVPVQMKDGRRLVVPVDHVEIHYVGRPSL